MTRRLAILAQFDPENGLPIHVRLHLERLRPVVERLVLVSNSALDPESFAQANDICDRVFVRENTGYDFAGWSDALVTEAASEYDWVILTNSSIIGPLYPLEPIFESMEARNPDVWGMVLSRNKGLHLQSYFLSASARVVNSDAWCAFWASVRNLDDKVKVIRSYEIGFSRTMIRAGFSLESLIELLHFPKNLRIVNIKCFKNRIKIPFNANYINRTVEFHEDLIRQGMPYLKASLLYGKDTYRFVGLDYIKEIPKVNFPFDALVPQRSR